MAKSDSQQRATGRERRRKAAENAQKRRRYLIAGGVALAALIAALGYFALTRDDDTDDPTFPPVVAARSSITAPINGTVAGDPDAAVAVHEWGDYQCPSCAQFEQEAVPVLIDEYVNTGLITFEFRDFAFLGPESTRSAEAASCALNQDRFWDMHSTIYANHNGENGGAYSDERLMEMAEGLDLDMATFEPCLDDSVHAEEVVNSYEEGSALGVNSTPTLIINGELVRYAGIDDLLARLDALLEG